MKRKALTLFLALCLAAPLLLPAAHSAAPADSVSYLPGVTQEMTEPSFWSDRASEPDALLATADEIARINSSALVTPGSNMHDLKNLPETYNGRERNASLLRGAQADADYYLGWTYDSSGKKFTREDFDKIVANCADSEALDSMPVRFGVAVNRTLLTCFPYDGQILDDPADLDFDYQGLVGIRVNEPVAAFTLSGDGKYYQVFTSCCSGWAPVEDLAFFESKEEWLAAVDIPAEKRLVFWGDKLYTDYSKSSPETSGRMITMGTVLERIDIDDPDALVINRLPIHNYAVYLPVRNEDGSCEKKPALINAREKLSEDFLPLTTANLAEVALASLGDAYGWGGTLNNEDCTSLNRNIFACFGLDLPRNGNWQWPMSVPRIDAAYMTTEEKEALLDELPLGTLLDFPGHQMMYLGKVDGKYYCVSTVSSMMSPYSGRRQRARSVQINDLDIKRANGRTWLQATNRIFIPWIYLAEGDESPLPESAWYHEGTALCLAGDLIDTFEGGYFRPDDTASRALAVSALWRAAGRPEPEEEALGFDDVESGASFEKALLWAKQRGIVTGTDEHTFAPDEALTREQLALLLYRVFKPEDTQGVMGLAGYADSTDIEDWAYEAMRFAVLTGLINGRGEGMLCPKEPMTRAELAVVLKRAADLRRRLEAEAAEAAAAQAENEAEQTAPDAGE